MVQNTFKDCSQKVGDHVYGTVLAFPKIYPACHTGYNGMTIKQGNDLTFADKHVAEHSRAGYWGIK